MNHGPALVVWLYADGGVHLARGRATNHQRDGESFTLHLGGHERHFLERRRDEPRETDDVDLLVAGDLQNLRARDHDAKVDHFVVVALQHHPHDVLANIVHIALDGRHKHFSLGARVRVGEFFGLDIGNEMRNGALHHARALHHLREKHLPRAEEVADDVHPRHQRPFDHFDRPLRQFPRFFGVVDHELCDAVYQRVGESLVHRAGAPGEVRAFGAGLALHAVGHFEQALRGVGATVEHHIFHTLEQLRRNVGIEREGAGVHDPHVHPRLHGVVEEHGVDRFAHRVVATEREADVAHATAHTGIRKRRLDLARGLNEVDRVVVVLFDPGGNRKDVGIEDDVLGGEAHAVHQDPVRTRADRELPLDGVGLPLFVERHHDDGGAVAPHERGLTNKLVFAFLQRDRVDNCFALDALESGLDHLPLGGVEHERHARDRRFGRREIEEGAHRFFGVQHAFIEVDVDDDRSRLDLLTRHFERGVVLPRENQLFELGRARDVRALADIHEIRGLGERKWLQSRQLERRRRRRRDMRRDTDHRLGDGLDVLRRGAAAAADHVHEARVGELAQHARREGRRFVVAAHLVREAGVWMHADPARCDAREFLDIAAQVAGAEGAVEPDRPGARVREGVEERLGGLPREGASALVGDRPADHDRESDAVFEEHLLDRKHGRLGVQCVEDGLDQQQVGSAGEQGARTFGVVVHELVERDVAEAGIFDLGRNASGTVGGAEDAGDVARATVACFEFVAQRAGDPCA